VHGTTLMRLRTRRDHRRTRRSP